MFGALAQLGERNTGSVEVSGSIPLGSTIHRDRLLSSHHLERGFGFHRGNAPRWPTRFRPPAFFAYPWVWPALKGEKDDV